MKCIWSMKKNHESLRRHVDENRQLLIKWPLFRKENIAQSNTRLQHTNGKGKLYTCLVKLFYK